jgi:hypothetical protein
MTRLRVMRDLFHPHLDKTLTQALAKVRLSLMDRPIKSTGISIDANDLIVFSVLALNSLPVIARDLVLIALNRPFIVFVAVRSGNIYALLELSLLHG